MNDITVSVIIPFYSNVGWLIEAVDSVFKQTFDQYEVIVINDGSKEDISTFLDKYQSKIIYKMKENGGPASARNLGIEMASGKYIAFLDSDDIWYKQKLKLQVKYMKESKAIWSHTSYSLFNDGNSKKLIKSLDLSYFKGNIFPRCLVSTPIATPCIMIKNQYLKENPTIRFNESMRFGQDWFLWINIAIKERLYVLPDVLTKVRVRGENAALRAKVQIKAKAQIWKYMLNNKDIFFGRDKANFIIRKAYQICFIGNALIELIENRLTKKVKVIEWLSRVIYILPYSVFKLLDRFWFKKF